MRKHPPSTKAITFCSHHRAKKNLPKETSNQEFYFLIWKLCRWASCIFISLSSNLGNLCSWLNLRVFSQPGGCGWLYPWGVVLEKEFFIFPETKKSKKGKKKKRENEAYKLWHQSTTGLYEAWPLMSLGSRRTSSSLIMFSHKTFRSHGNHWGLQVNLIKWVHELSKMFVDFGVYMHFSEETVSNSPTGKWPHEI